jgi:hypothetical protein
MIYEIWDGDLFLFTVDDSFEADIQAEAGFTVREVSARA